MYIATQIRPNFMVVTSMFASYLHAPTMSRMVAAKRSLRHIKRTRVRKFVSTPADVDQLTASVDESRANSYEKGRRSRSGMIGKYGNAVIGAATNFQNCVCLSFTDAEYVVLSKVVKTIVWLKNVKQELGVPQDQTQVFQDDSGCIERVLGAHAKHLNKRKLIDVIYHLSCRWLRTKKAS